MKKIVFILLLIPFTCFSQIKIDSITRDISFRKVFNSDLSKEQLKDKVNLWFHKNYKNANNVIKVNTSDNIFASAALVANKSIKLYISYDVDVSFKEKKYKLEINNFQQYVIGYKQFKTNVPVMTGIGFDEYKKLVLLASEKISGQAKDMLLKRLNNNSLAMEDFKNSKAQNLILENKIRAEITSISKGIQSALKKNAKKDDW